MSDELDPVREADAQRLTASLQSFAHGFNLDEATARNIVEKVPLIRPPARTASA